ncbi:MAG: HAD family hydrolase [Candidatus Parvarchaeota archaeon]|nr:HAD family hydrolase [Candidatus Jingweiarchaeum tengchongense]MCW1297693.1 HAD family hydrolase [Candidatus Jingweiarchaeum tengchongense]MCW1299704.1 HAD family hydrolase [Candidatus Jingweiarchaeum tengchongense]MCW1304328.1 HAD family hydrolase [Candidatus Jingweiarchaeum tengchongense]MCW1305689.1 HAD family hydrolase [Candidatus Jingweiarchaeum tengchongense]
MGEIEGIIFDIDGVIIDSEEALYRYYRDLFLQFGFKEIKRERIMKFNGYADRDWITALLPKSERKNKNLVNEMVKIGVRIYGPYYLAKYAKLFNGAKQILKELKKRYELAIVTNNTRGDVRIIIKKFGLGGIFDAIVTINDVKNPKPSPEPLILASKKLGIPRQNLLYIGDTKVDRETGRRAKIKTIIINKNGKPDYSLLRKYLPKYLAPKYNK